MTTTAYPPGFVPIETAVGAVKYMTLSAAYAGSLVVPLGLLMLCCPTGVRKTPVFYTLVLCLLLGIIWAFLSFAENIRSVDSPLDAPIRGIFLGSSSLNFIIPIFTDSVLIWKILWLFPGFTFPAYQRALLIAPPLLITVPRLVVISIFLDKAGMAFDSTGGVLAASTYLSTSKLALVEFILQFVSNLYCSIVLLTQAYRLAHSSNIKASRSTRLSGKFIRMFRVLASSFILPVCIELALIISFSVTDNQFIREPIQWSNTYISLHCAVLATVWSTIGDRMENNKSLESTGNSFRTNSSPRSNTSDTESQNTSKEAFGQDSKSDSLTSFAISRGEKAGTSPTISSWRKPVSRQQSQPPLQPLQVNIDVDSFTFHDP